MDKNKSLKSNFVDPLLLLEVDRVERYRSSTPFTAVVDGVVITGDLTNEKTGAGLLRFHAGPDATRLPRASPDGERYVYVLNAEVYRLHDALPITRMPVLRVRLSAVVSWFCGIAAEAARKDL